MAQPETSRTWVQILAAAAAAAQEARTVAPTTTDRLHRQSELFNPIVAEAAGKLGDELKRFAARQQEAPKPKDAPAPDSAP